MNEVVDPHQPQRWRRLRYVGGAAAAVAAVAGVYAITHANTRTETTDSRAAQGQTVTVVRVAPAAFERQLAMSGQVAPRRDVRVYAPTSGVRVLELLVDEGDYVRQGQPLARLDQALSTAQLRSAEAAVKEAQVNAQAARADAARAESVRELGALSAEAIATRVAQAEAAEARYAAAQAQLGEVQARLQGGFVRAPASGLVIERPALAGQLVDGQPLFRIAANNALDVAVEVSEADMLALKEGQTARFTMIDGTEITGRLRRTPGSIDPRTRTGEALFALPANQKLRAGMFLRGQASLPAVERLSAPQSAVLFANGEAYVFAIDDQNRARRVVVSLGAREGDQIAIERGLEAGTRIAASGAAFLQDGDLVAPVEPDAPSASAPAAPAAEAEATARRGG